MLARNLFPTFVVAVDSPYSLKSTAAMSRCAIRVIADTLVSNGGKPMPVNDAVRVSKWNKSFRPRLVCLFSIKSSLPSSSTTVVRSP